jgi:DNA repair protein RecN (Recombination protein N)
LQKWLHLASNLQYPPSNEFEWNIEYRMQIDKSIFFLQIMLARLRMCVFFCTFARYFAKYMLTHLHIRNYALISHLDIDFHEGFSVMTGETGAGKSIILGALNLVMGARADIKSITEGEDKCVIEALFRPSSAVRSQIASLLDRSQSELLDTLVIRRELSASGRSRSFVNDEVVTQAELKALARQLIDIHSQHESLMIGDDLFQIQVVDAIAGNNSEREAYAAAYTNYQEAVAALHKAEALAKKIQADADYLQWQYQQLVEAQLVAGEIEELEEEEYRLSHAEEIQASLAQALQQLDSDQGALAMIHSAGSGLFKVVQNGSELSRVTERLDSVEIELKDILSDIQRLYDRTELDPMRLEQVGERLSMLQTLMKKHRVQTVEELIALREEYAEQVQRIENIDEEIERLRVESVRLKGEAERAAQQLTQSRKSVCEKIAMHLVEDMQRLGVPHAKVAVDIQPTEDFTETGKDNVQFMFAANLNQSLRRVAEVASGGEISRLMLCIKALIASSNGLPTIIFDEIDTGVSGAIASQMGEIMRQMGTSRQIITITHLPQVAARGEQHYLVYKEDTDVRTETHIRVLTEAEHEQEIEKMRQL